MSLGEVVEGFVPPPRPSGVLTGRYARLEPLVAGHAAALVRAFAPAPETWDYMLGGPFETPEDFAATYARMGAGGDPYFHAIFAEGEHAPSGVQSFMRINPQAGSIELGHIALSPGLRRSRAATEAFVLAMAWAFEAGYRRFEWKCNALNLPSRRAAQRLGMSFEGVHRQALIVKGRNRDTAWFSVIDGEWPALRDAFETWLAPGNFEAGRQTLSLSALTAPLLAARDPALAD